MSTAIKHHVPHCIKPSFVLTSGTLMLSAELSIGLAQAAL